MKQIGAFVLFRFDSRRRLKGGDSRVSPVSFFRSCVDALPCLPWISELPLSDDLLFVFPLAIIQVFAIASAKVQN